jgi:hypothetical protein
LIDAEFVVQGISNKENDNRRDGTMTERLRSYEVARKTFSFLEFIGWSVVVIGIITGFALVESADRYATDSQKFLLFLIGAGASMVGLFMVGSVQNWRAGVDSAEYGQQALRIAREQLEISKQSLKRGQADQNSFSSLRSVVEHKAGASFEGNNASSSRPMKSPDSDVHKGRKFIRVGGSYLAIGETSTSHDNAISTIDAKSDDPVLSSEIEDVNDMPAPQTFSDTRAFLKAEKIAGSNKAKAVDTPIDDTRDEDHKSPNEEDDAAEVVSEVDFIGSASPQESTQEASIPSPQPVTEIREEDGKFTYGRLEFSSREAAEKYVKQLGVNPNYKG